MSFNIQQTNLTDYFIWHLFAQRIDAFCVCRSLPQSRSLCRDNINGCHQSLDAAASVYSPDLGQDLAPLSQGCIQEDSIIIISTLAAAKIQPGFYIYSKVSFSLSLIPENSLRQVGARGSLASSGRWILHETSLDLRALSNAGEDGVYIKMGNIFYATSSNSCLFVFAPESVDNSSLSLWRIIWKLNEKLFQKILQKYNQP